MRGGAEKPGGTEAAGEVQAVGAKRYLESNVHVGKIVISGM